jgi:hypothetical protein
MISIWMLFVKQGEEWYMYGSHPYMCETAAELAVKQGDKLGYTMKAVEYTPRSKYEPARTIVCEEQS